MDFLRENFEKRLEMLLDIHYITKKTKITYNLNWEISIYYTHIFTVLSQEEKEWF
jgi:hypothetical protein